MRVTDLIYLAGGLKEDAYKPRATLVRVSVDNGHATHRSYDLNLTDIISGAANEDPVLRANDELFISSVIDYNLPQRSVVVNGEVQSPGMYNFNEGMHIRDLIAAAGGFKDDADKQKVEVARTQVISGTRTRRVFVQLDLRRGSSDLNYPLYFNDEVFVTVTPNWHLPWVVTVSGEVSKPGQYPIHDDERLSSLIVRCGGFLPGSSPKAIVFTRSSVQQMEQKDLDEARQRLTNELAQLSIQSSALQTVSSSSTGAQTAVAGSMASLQQLLATGAGQQADGRVLVHVNDILNGDENQDIVLQDGDSITVPKQPASVNVLGQVFHPTSVVVRHSMTVADYLYAAGGATPQGDVNRLMVIKADGSIVTQAGFDNSRQSSLFPLLPLISGGLMSQSLEPGDTVYVPESLADLQSAIRMGYWGDITKIIANAASTVAVIGLLAFAR
jgi:polysaccharide biosynthesis/export protein